MPTISPPDVPPGLDPKLADFLTRLSVWALRQLDQKAPLDEAITALHFLPSDQKPPQTVMLLQVSSTGTVQVSSMPLGGGKP